MRVFDSGIQRAPGEQVWPRGWPHDLTPRMADGWLRAGYALPTLPDDADPRALRYLGGQIRPGPADPSLAHARATYYPPSGYVIDPATGALVAPSRE